MSFNNLLRELNNFHRRHGVTILFNEPKPFWIRVAEFYLKVSGACAILMLFFSSTKTFSNNDAINRLLNLLGSIIVLEVLLNEALFWFRRKKVLEIVEWCRRVEEAQHFDAFQNPIDWFSEKRKRILFINRFVSTTMVMLFVLLGLLGPIFQTYYNGRYQLVVSFDFKNFSEKELISVRIGEFLIFTSALWFISSIILFSFSFAILFIYYIIGQFELIQFYISQLDLSDVKKLRYQLKQITAMHLDVLRTIKKISKLFVIVLKTKEYDMYLYVSVIIFGKDMMSIVIPPSGIIVMAAVGIFCQACENMMEAENNIRDAYYELEWYEASIKSKKLLLLAMQEPDQIRFGRIFATDYASMERFLVLVRRAYDFGLALLKLTK